MKDLPPGLPPADSRTWHNRRWWDPLGYLRARSLANPNWARDMPWLIKWLRRDRETALPADRELYERAISAAREYARTTSGTKAAECAWDNMLAPIDELLMRNQERHMEEVRRARDPGSG